MFPLLNQASLYGPEACQALTAAAVLTSRPEWMLETDSTRDSWAMLLKAGPEAFARLQIGGLSGRVLPRLRVAPSIRTADTNRLAYAEAAQRWMAGLKPADVASPMVQGALALTACHLEAVVKETNHLLLEGETLPQLIFESLQNDLWEGDHQVQLVRLHMNMTTANQVDGHKGFVGTSLRQNTLLWLEETFGKANVFVDPVGTAFLIKVPSFSEARGHLSRFSYEVHRRILEDPVVQKHVSWEQLRSFVPLHTAVGRTLSVQELNLGRLPNVTVDEEAERQKIQAAVIDEIREFLKRLAGEASSLEKHPPLRDLSNPLFVRMDLPPRTDPFFADYSDSVREGRGYVSAGVYGLPVREGENATLVGNPRFRRLTGHLDRRENLRGGGVLQRFIAATGALLASDQDDLPQAFQAFHEIVSMEPSDTPVLGGLGLTLHGTLSDLLEIGLAARRFTAYPDLVKPHEIRTNARGRTENANFFIEEMAYRQYRYLAGSENDGAKARRNAYPPKDHVDADFQRVRQIWLETAREMGMVNEDGSLRVVIAPFQGDMIAVGFDTGEHAPEIYLHEVQRRVREAFHDQPFQREEKARRGGEVVRLPIWRRAAGASPTAPEFVLSRVQPQGYEPLIGRQTITTTYVTLPSAIEDPAARHDAMSRFSRMSAFIDEVLKDQRGTGELPDGTRFSLTKEGFGPMPDDWSPKSHPG